MAQSGKLFKWVSCSRQWESLFMKAVVLAGGLRSGLEIAGSGLPRALWPFPSKPLITHVIDFLKRSGCEQIAICANGKTRLIATELSSGAYEYTDLHYSEDPLPRGPAGCLRDLQAWLGDETFIAIQGTACYDFELEAMVEEHRRTGAAITVGARRCPDDVDLLEPAGVYLVEPNTLPLIQAQGYQDFKEQFLPKVIASGMRVRCHSLKGSATLIHSPGHYLSALRDAIVRSAAQPPKGYRLMGDNVVVHETAVVHPTARITGPVWIDAGAVVEDRAVIAGPVVLGAKARVGCGALVHRTVAMHDAVVVAGAEVFSAILPPHSTKAARAKKASVGGRDAAPAATASRDSGWPSMRGRFDRLLNMFDAGRAHPTPR
jgi:NDP-sugar pyrophosphorylase family protein